MGKHWILEGEEPVEVDFMTWAKWLGDGNNRKILSAHVGEVYVSTVFLGIDHQFGDGHPLLFETMVFGGELDEEQERYSTFEEARKGHLTMLDRVREAEVRDA